MKAYLVVVDLWIMGAYIYQYKQYYKKCKSKDRFFHIITEFRDDFNYFA